MNLEYSLRCHEYACTAIHISSENRQLITGDESGICIFWSLDTRRPIWKIPVGSSSILSVNLLADFLIVQNRDNLIYFYSVPTEVSGLKPFNAKDGLVHDGMTPLLTLPCESLHFCQFKRRESMILFTLTDPLRLVVFSIPSTESISSSVELKSCLRFIELPKGKGSCIAVEFLDDFSALAGFEDGSVVIQNLSRDLSCVELEKKHSEAILCLGVSSHSIISAGADQMILIHDNRGKWKRTVTLANPGVASLGTFDDCFVVCSWSGDIILYNYQGDCVGPSFREHRKPLRCSTAGCLSQRSSWRPSQDDNQVETIFIGSEDCRISCWTIDLKV